MIDPCKNCKKPYVGCKYACLRYQVFTGDADAVFMAKEIALAKRRAKYKEKKALEAQKRWQDIADIISATEQERKEKNRACRARYRQEHKDEINAKRREKARLEREARGKPARDKFIPKSKRK